MNAATHSTLVSMTPIPANNNRTGRQRYLTPDLLQLIPSSLLDGRSNKEVANVALAELELVGLFHTASRFGFCLIRN